MLPCCLLPRLKPVSRRLPPCRTLPSLRSSSRRPPRPVRCRAQLQPVPTWGLRVCDLIAKPRSPASCSKKEISRRKSKSRRDLLTPTSFPPRLRPTRAPKQTARPSSEYAHLQRVKEARARSRSGPRAGRCPIRSLLDRPQRRRASRPCSHAQSADNPASNHRLPLGTALVAVRAGSGREVAAAGADGEDLRVPDRRVSRSAGARGRLLRVLLVLRMRPDLSGRALA